MCIKEPLRLSETINESGLEVDPEHLSTRVDQEFQIVQR